ncbi:MAG TPA: hypothetical protein VHX65_12380 [Pirellulales bacterium]|nr:hypothetical protein [Pirellulales bacterium]
MKQPLDRRRRKIGLVVGIACAIVAAAAGIASVGRTLFDRQILVDALQRSKEECRRADDNLLLAMATFGDRIDPLGLESKLLPREELAFYKSIYDEAGDEPADRFAIAMARRRAGLLHLKLHEFEDARLCFVLSVHMLETLAVEKPAPELAPLYRRTLAETYADEGAYHAATGDIAAAEARFEAALALVSSLIAKMPDADDLLAAQARFWQARGAMYARLHRWADAEADLKRALAPRIALLFTGESKVWLGSPPCELTETWSVLGDVFRETGRTHAAIDLLDQATTVYAQFGRFRADLHYREGLAHIGDELAAAYGENGQLAESVAANRKALAAYEALGADFPEIAAFRQQQVQIESRLGASEKISGKRE